MATLECQVYLSVNESSQVDANRFGTNREPVLGDVFPPIVELKSNSPLVQDLQFAAEIWAFQLSSQRPERVSATLARLMIEQLPPETLETGLSQAIAQINEETTYFQELEDVGIEPYSLINGVEGRKKGTFIMLVAPNSWIVQTYNKGKPRLGKRSGQIESRVKDYSHLFKVTLIGDPKPKLNDIFRCLATEGALPATFTKIQQDLMQKMHIENRERVLFAALSITPILALPFEFNLATLTFSAASKIAQGIQLNGITKDRDLRDLNAQAVLTSSPIASEVTRSIPEGKPLDNLATQVINQIRILRYLGRRQGVKDVNQFIAQLIQQAKFDKVTKSYPLISEAVKNALCAEGIADPQEQKIVGEAILVDQRVNLSQTQQKVAQISSRVLQEAYWRQQGITK